MGVLAPSSPCLDRCSTVSSTTSSGCRWQKCSFPAWPISFRVIRRGRHQKGSIRWAITCRIGPTLSFRSCTRQWRRRRRSMMSSLGIISAQTRSRQSWERSGSPQKVNGRPRAFFTLLGPLFNGFINYEFWLPVAKMQFPGVADLISRYQARAASEGVDPLGYYMPPWAYAQLQVLHQAVEATKTLDDVKLGDYIRANPFTTVVGEVRFGAE